MSIERWLRRAALFGVVLAATPACVVSVGSSSRSESSRLRDLEDRIARAERELGIPAEEAVR